MSLPQLLAGGFDIALAAFHLCFWRLLGWPSSLRPAGRINASVTQILNGMLAYVFAAFGLALAIHAIVGKPVDPIIPALAAGFWIIRAVLQPIMFSPSAPWSIVLTCVFGLGAFLHVWAAWPVTG